MKIMIAVTDSYCANLIRGQAAFLHDHGLGVLLVSGDGPEIRHLAKTERCRSIAVDFAKDISVIRDLYCLYRIIILISKEKPEIVNAGNPKPGLLFAIALLLFPRTRFVFTLRGLRSDTMPGIKGTIVRFCEYLSCRLADKVIVISPSLREHAIQKGITSLEKSLVIGSGSSNGIDTKRFSKSKELLLKAKRFRSRLKIGEGTFVFLYIGRVAKDKGINEMCKAFTALNDENATLIIAGPPEYTDPLEDDTRQLIARNNNIIQLGKVKTVEILYAAANALILFSHREGFGNVVMEAAAMGTPSIVADIPGLRDTVINYYTGIHVDKKNTVALQHAMRFYIKEKERLLPLHGENAALRARKCFDRSHIWQGQLNLYKMLLKKERPR
ncbi:glycosyltransferase [Flavobacterium sp. AG291]|uniref:glycosyltransferase n=1 Tax=Flavobacterium sp. AG291 TaxID=2184000 RepID=UPI000E0BA8B3|nr:glycosyltransferase [Flavobacterium sp. AG291]RDI11229.1 glycosyltransferase involved in cell wall biosynthesis [Flavobacterium sp. AG291]